MNRIEFIRDYKIVDPDATREDISAAWVEYREEKRLAREAKAEEKRLAREAEAEEKRLAREAEEKRLAREAEEKRLALELAIEQEKTKQGLGWSSLFLSLSVSSIAFPSFDPSVQLICLCGVGVRCSLSLFLSLSLPVSLFIFTCLWWCRSPGVSGGGGATTDPNGTTSACFICRVLEFSSC
jgi:hypothetical protein